MSVRRAVAVLALGLSACVSAAPASASAGGCVTDWATLRPYPHVMPAEPVEVTIGGGTVSVGSPWAYGIAMSEVDRAWTLVNCVV